MTTEHDEGFAVGIEAAASYMLRTCIDEGSAILFSQGIRNLKPAPRSAEHTAEPSAQGEREQFYDWWHKEQTQVISGFELAWGAWQARAALATAPSTSIEAEPVACSHPSWKKLNGGKEQCELCGAVGREMRYLSVDDAAPPDRTPAARSTSDAEDEMHALTKAALGDARVKLTGSDDIGDLFEDSSTSDAAVDRPAPDLLDDDERAALLKQAEYLWEALQANDLGGFSGINRPFFIFDRFKRVIEKFGRRDVGLHWSKNDLDAVLADRATRSTDSSAEAFREAAARDSKIADMASKYTELLYAVSNKHPDESRHETALRYIRQAEAAKLTSDNGVKPPTVIAEIAAERQRQISVKGWTREHDDEHDNGDLAVAAACYTLWGCKRKIPIVWPWGNAWNPGSPRRALIKAGALIVAELERIDRAEAAKLTTAPHTADETRGAETEARDAYLADDAADFKRRGDRDDAAIGDM